MERIDELKKRLKASEGQPGFEGRVAALRAEIANMEALAEPKPKAKAKAKVARHRSADNGKFVDKTAAKADPKGTVKETR